jgi:hypothetical protein
MATLIVRISREEHRQIKREAKERGLTMSDLVRKRVLPGEDLNASVTRGETGAATPKTRRGE